MKKSFIATLLFCAAFVQAQVVIEQVYPNPAGTESGGEAILLRNTAGNPVSLENWTLATMASARDVVFPAITLEPNQLFLVADTGWKEKRDDLAWREADLEETITLANEDGGIAIIDNAGNTVDTVGWGDPANMRTPLFMGIPAPTPPQQKALARVANSRNNAQDFIVAEPDFEAADVIVIVVTVANQTITINEVKILPDEQEKEGVQIAPPQSGQKRIIVKAAVDGDAALVAKLLNQTIELEQVNESSYEGFFLVDARFPAGTYTIEVIGENTSAKATFEYLPVKKVSIEKTQVSISTKAGQRASGSVIVQNKGNVPLKLETLLVGNNSLNIEVSLDGLVFKKPADLNIELAPGQERKVHVAINAPQKAGVYKTRLRIRDVS